MSDSIAAAWAPYGDGGPLHPDPYVIVAPYHRPEAAGPVEAVRLSAALLATYDDPASVVYAVGVPHCGGWPRPVKAWLGEGGPAGAALVVAFVDLDRPEHAPWSSEAEADEAAGVVYGAAAEAFGGRPYVWPSPRGVRIAALPHAPIPLALAADHLRRAWDLAGPIALAAGLRRPDALTWTTGQRPPKVRRESPWTWDFPPYRGSSLLTPGRDLGACRREAWRVGDGRTPAPAGAEVARAEFAAFRAEVDRMAEVVRASGARHPVLFALARRVGGWLAWYTADAAAVLAEVAAARLVDAAPGSADADRTVADGIAAGAAWPECPPWRILAAVRRGVGVRT